MMIPELRWLIITRALLDVFCSPNYKSLIQFQQDYWPHFNDTYESSTRWIKDEMDLILDEIIDLEIKEEKRK